MNQRVGKVGEEVEVETEMLKQIEHRVNDPLPPVLHRSKYVIVQPGEVWIYSLG